MPDARRDVPEPVLRLLHRAEDVVYVLVSVLLVLTSLVLVAKAGYDLVVESPEGVVDAVILALDPLLLVFILVELLSAVRETIAKRRLLAEPFLLVGIIASIKEVVVTSVKVGDLDGDQFEEAMIEVGVLAALLLFLALASFLLRLKEREPAESGEPQ